MRPHSPRVGIGAGAGEAVMTGFPEIGNALVEKGQNTDGVKDPAVV